MTGGTKASTIIKLPFPFIFEIMIVPIIECTDTFFSNQIDDDGVIFIGDLNYSTTPTGTGSEYFDAGTKASPR
jgi:hypothetical protein